MFLEAFCTITIAMLLESCPSDEVFPLYMLLMLDHHQTPDTRLCPNNLLVWVHKPIPVSARGHHSAVPADPGDAQDACCDLRCEHSRLLAGHYPDVQKTDVEISPIVPA